jgi:hypothetical protein
MMAVAHVMKSIFCLKNSKYLDITFSYSFPLYDEIHLVKHMMECLDDIVDTGLIILDYSDNFSKISISDEEAYNKCMKNDCAYLIRRNSKDISINKQSNLYSLLINWRNFCRSKFKKIYSKKIIDVYMKLFVQSGFMPITYSYNGDIMAQEIYYKSPRSNTNYICIFIWNKEYKNRCPGKYAYALSIEECKKENRFFSYCYGAQNYKKTWMKPFLESGIR